MPGTLLGTALWNEICNAVDPNRLTEVRVRVGRPIVVRDESSRHLINVQGSRFLIDEIVGRATRHSLYAYQQEITSGYLYYPGGIRIGLSGRGVVRDGKLEGFKDLFSLNIRFPHEVKGCARQLGEIMRTFDSTLVVSPPFGGKTTLIRDMAAQLSHRFDVCMVDERGELAGDGFTFGPFLDVIANVPKHIAIEGVIRALSPEIIVLDEIYPPRDMRTLEEIARAGIKFIASAHARDFTDLAKSCPAILGLFRYGVALSDKPRVGHIQSIVRLGGD